MKRTGHATRKRNPIIKILLKRHSSFNGYVYFSITKFDEGIGNLYY
jgi:hypothetical protein